VLSVPFHAHINSRPQPRVFLGRSPGASHADRLLLGTDGCNRHDERASGSRIRLPRAHPAAVLPPPTRRCPARLGVAPASRRRPDSPLTPQQLANLVWETMRLVQDRRYLAARSYIDETIRPALSPIADSHRPHLLRIADDLAGQLSPFA
jgi:hypothetical protein